MSTGPVLEPDRLFIALTRPQMFAGVTYNYFIVNFVLTAELFLITSSFRVLPLSLLWHGLGVLLCVREPRTLDLWLTRASRCGRIRNYSFWRCNSYRP